MMIPESLEVGTWVSTYSGDEEGVIICQVRDYLFSPPDNVIHVVHVLEIPEKLVAAGYEDLGPWRRDFVWHLDPIVDSSTGLLPSTFEDAMTIFCFAPRLGDMRLDYSPEFPGWWFFPREYRKNPAHIANPGEDPAEIRRRVEHHMDGGDPWWLPL